MIKKLVNLLFKNYMPKIHAFVTEREERNKQLYALGVESGEAINQLTADFKKFEDRQYQVFEEMFAIYHEILRQEDALEKGTPPSEETGLPRTIGDPTLREKVAYYLEMLHHDDDK